MSTRTATVADLDAIMTLERASFPTDAWSDAMMREELASPHGWYVVIEELGRVVGYAGLRAVRGARDADVQTITISESARGRGRGRALLGNLLDEAVRRGVHEVFLEVRADNPVAQKLYLSEGFVEVGRRPRYYQPDDVDALVMQLDLRGWAARRAETASAGPLLTGSESAAVPASGPGALRDAEAGGLQGAETGELEKADAIDGAGHLPSRPPFPERAGADERAPRARHRDQLR